MKQIVQDISAINKREAMFIYMVWFNFQERYALSLCIINTMNVLCLRTHVFFDLRLKLFVYMNMTRVGNGNLCLCKG